MLHKTLLLFSFLFGSLFVFGQKDDCIHDTSGVIGKIIFNQHCDSFPEIYMMPEWYKLQLIYVQIDRDKNGYL